MSLKTKDGNKRIPALSHRNRRNRITALSRGERVARSGAFISRSVTGEGSVRDQARLSIPRLPCRNSSFVLILKLKERTGNVYENKRPMWKTGLSQSVLAQADGKR